MVAADVLHKAWGTGLNDEFSYKLNPVRGNNPLIFWRHPGGGVNGTHLELWDQGGALYGDVTKLIEYLMDPAREVHFDVVSLGTPQMVLGPAMPRSMRTFVPGIITSFQRSIRNASMIMKEIAGSDPERKGTVTSSHGSWLAMMSGLWQPEFGGSGQRPERRGRFDTRGYNSRCKFMIPLTLPYPDFRRLCTPTGLTFTGTISLSGGVSRIAAAGAFSKYRLVAGDVVIFTNAGVQYTKTVGNKISGNAVDLTTNTGLAGAVTGYISTDQVDLSWSGMTYGTRPKDAPDAFGNPDYAEWDLLPQGCKEAISILYWIEQNQLAFMPPTYFINELAGNGIKPYGNTYDAGANIHDWHGAQAVSDGLRAKGKSSTFESYPLGDFSKWADYTFPAKLYNWMVARIAE